MLLVNITPQHTVVGLDRSVGTSNDCRRKMSAPFWDSMFRKSRNCSPDSVWCPRAKGLFVKCLVMSLIKQIKKIYHGLKVLVDKVKACYWKLNSFFRLAHNSTYLPFKKRLKIKKMCQVNCHWYFLALFDESFYSPHTTTTILRK